MDGLHHGIVGIKLKDGGNGLGKGHRLKVLL